MASPFLALLFALSSNHVPPPPADGKDNQCIQNNTMNFPFFPHVEWGWQQAYKYFHSLGGGLISVRGSTPFAVTLAARRVFVLTIRMPANGKCFFMLRSGKFNNTLAGFMLSSKNRMNMERACDLKSSNSVSPEVGNNQLWIWSPLPSLLHPPG